MPFQTYFVYILTFFIFPLYIKSAKMSSFVFYKERERKKTTIQVWDNIPSKGKACDICTTNKQH